MKVNKKVIRWLLAGLGILIACLTAVSAALPRLLDLEMVREKAVQAASRELGGPVSIESIDAGLLPPRIIFSKTTLSIPGRMTGSVGLLEVYPRILPLIRGRIELSGISAHGPDLVVRFPQVQQAKVRQPYEPLLLSIQKAFANVSAKAAGLSVDIAQGRVKLETEKLAVTFDNVTAAVSLSSDTVRLNLNCTAPFSEKVSLTLKMSPESFKGKGELNLTRFLPHLLPNVLAPSLLSIIGEAAGDIHMDLSSEDASTLHIEARASFPHVVLSRGKDIPLINLQDLQVVYDISGRKDEVILKSLKCSSPALSVSGRLVKGKDDGQVVLELYGEEIDIGGLRLAVLAALPDVPAVRNIFGYLQNGKVPRIRFRTDGESLSALGRTENLSVEGSLSEGNVYIPGPDLLFNHVSGDVVISQGILKGSNIAAHLRGIKGERATLRVGLRGRDAPIHMETSFRSNAQDVIELLRHFTRKSVLSDEVGMSRDISGSTEGRVVVGERLDAITVAVDAPNTNISATHRVFPSRPTLHGLSLEVRDRGITVRSAGFSIGQSRFTAKGEVSFRDRGLILDMDVASPRIIWEDIAGRAGGGIRDNEPPGKGKKGSQQFQGIVRLRAETFDFGKYQVAPFPADISLNPKATKIAVKNAKFCGIRTSGTASLSQTGTSVDIHLDAHDQELRPTVFCLSKERSEATGSFSLGADLQGKGRTETLGKSIKGKFDFTAREGSISRNRSLDSVFDFLNEGEEVKGQLPDLDKGAFRYKLLKGKGTLKSGSLMLEEAILESSAVHLVSRGSIDIEEGALDLDVMVAVNKAADKIIRGTPLIGTIFGGSLISVPVKVRGSIAEPQVIYLSPSVAVSNLTDMMRRTAGLPLEVLSPFLRKEKQ